MSIPTIFERRWPTVVLTPISISNHVVTVSSTKGLHVKQPITLSNIGQSPVEMEVKRVISDTQLHIGYINNPINQYENPTLYSGGTLIAVESERNKFGNEIVWRAVYEEEPAVAIRSMLVDWLGRYVDTVQDINGINRLAVDTHLDTSGLTVTIEEATKAGIINVTSPSTPNTQFTITIPTGVKHFIIKPHRTSQAHLDIALSAFISNPAIYTVSPGDEFKSGNIRLYNPLSLYTKTNKPSETFEVWYWWV